MNLGKRARALTAQEETTLTMRLQRYYKLKDRFDIMEEHLGRAPTMEEFAEQLGTADVDRISALMVSGPDVKAAFVKHNMGLVVSVCQKYHTEDVAMSVCQLLGCNATISERDYPIMSLAAWCCRILYLRACLAYYEQPESLTPPRASSSPLMHTGG